MGKLHSYSSKTGVLTSGNSAGQRVRPLQEGKTCSVSPSHILGEGVCHWRSYPALSVFGWKDIWMDMDGLICELMLNKNLIFNKSSFIWTSANNEITLSKWQKNWNLIWSVFCASGHPNMGGPMQRMTPPRGMVPLGPQVGEQRHYGHAMRILNLALVTHLQT